MRILRTFGNNAKAAEDTIFELETRGASSTAKVDDVVQKILTAVRERGDEALREVAASFDGLAPEQPLRVSREEMPWCMGRHKRGAESSDAIGLKRISEHLLKSSCREHGVFRPTDGMEVGQIIRPLGSVGCYVPGGRYPLPSTLLMTATPAQVAGVERIVVCSPKPARETMAAAYLADCNRVLPCRWCTSNRRHGIRHKNHRPSRQDCGTGQSICHRSQSGRIAAYRHRYAGWSDRDRRYERIRRSRWHRSGFGSPGGA